MAYTQADLDMLDRAIATGAREVQYADRRRTVFRTLAEMNLTREIILRELGQAPKTRTIIVEHTR